MRGGSRSHEKTAMKQHLENLQMDREIKRRSSLHARISSAVAGLRTTLLALACTAAAGSCIAAVNTPPTGQDLFIVTVANVPASIVLKGTDVDGDPLTFSFASNPQHGGLSGTLPNLIYTPQPGFVGLDGFTYVVRDGQAASTPATVNIIVKHGLSINNVSVTEGNSGTRAATFTVTMTGLGCGLDTVDVFVATKDGTAKAGSDYVTTLGVLSFPPGVLSQAITVPVIGDTRFEFNESFSVQLSNPSINAVITNGIGRGTILNDDSSVSTLGIAALTPDDSVVSVGEPVSLSLDWTHPVGWRRLESIDLRLVDDEGESLAVRWHEAPNSFSLFNPAADRFGRTAGAGSPTQFETSVATLSLQQSTGGGPPGQTVTIEYNLSFKPQAAGRMFNVEVAATDDAGIQQGFEPVGTITVLPHSHDQ
jgi:hypothetical protein